MKTEDKIFNIKISFLTLCFYCISISCVRPPEQTDGLLENIPAIVNETDYFSISVLADDYTDSLFYDLNLVAAESDILLTTFVLKDLDINVKDSSYFTILAEEGDTILNFLIDSEATLYGEDSVSVIGLPDIIIFDTKNFNGRLEYQILKK